MERGTCGLGISLYSTQMHDRLLQKLPGKTVQGNLLISGILQPQSFNLLISFGTVCHKTIDAKLNSMQKKQWPKQ